VTVLRKKGRAGKTRKDERNGWGEISLACIYTPPHLAFVVDAIRRRMDPVSETVYGAGRPAKTDVEEITETTRSCLNYLYRALPTCLLEVSFNDQYSSEVISVVSRYGRYQGFEC
jgi:hypothetical protein